MTPGVLQKKIVASRASWIRKMLDGIRALPLDDFDRFAADDRNGAAADSYLRRALEALLDLGRHVAARGFGRSAAEYKEVANVLHDLGLLGSDDAELLRTMAGYRNRLVHFYDEISTAELHEICRSQLDDVDRILNVLLDWVRRHPDKIDDQL
jgi:uncharacterized protein YutE (UPF0331/DUF86 family)